MNTVSTVVASIDETTLEINVYHTGGEVELCFDMKGNSNSCDNFDLTKYQNPFVYELKIKDPDEGDNFDICYKLEDNNQNGCKEFELKGRSLETVDLILPGASTNPSSMNATQANATSADITNLVDGQYPLKLGGKVGLIEPTFTYAAYQNGSFYNFYTKYSHLLWDNDRNITSITTDLNLLKDRPIPHGPFPYYRHPEYKDIPYVHYFNVLLQHVKKNNTFVSNITDVDVHEGNIFQNNGKNAYDVLFLFHSEYVTQSEYNNLKKFVTNGGTIVFTEANILYAEVGYNKSSDSISLVNGHDWKFDGNSATKGTSERWLDENKEWMGSNFLNIPSWEKVYFRNNPFNYNHTEDQYVTNPNAKILLDYKAYNLTDKYQNATVATYMMSYGKGKVVNLGIWGHTLTDNEKFLNYFDKVIMPIAYDLNINSSIMDRMVGINSEDSVQGNVLENINAYISTYYNDLIHSTNNSNIGSECTKYDSNTSMITVNCDSNLPEIYHVVNNKSVLDKEPDGVWILNASIKVNPLAHLTINNTDTSWLKIINKGDREPNFISVYGGAKIDGIKITSWDPYSNDTIKQNVNGSLPRPYILVAKGVGGVNISNSEIAFLGYNSYPSNGLVFVGGESGSLLINNTIHDMWDGFYSDSSGFIKIIKNEFYNNHRDGIDPHSGSHDLDIIGNLAYNNSEMGIICSENCYNILFDRNIVHDNGLAGLMFSLNTTNSTAIKNYAYDEKVGISIYSSSNNKAYDNLLKSTDKGLFIGGNSSYNHIFNNSLVNDTVGIDFDDFPKDNVLKNNIISNVIFDSHQANESLNKKTSIYGCEPTDVYDYLHCDPFKSEFEVNRYF